MGLTVAGDRHPGTKHFVPLFAADHLPQGQIRETSLLCAELAQEMLDSIEDGPELMAGLRKLLEAKDCFVRAVVLARNKG